MPRVIAKTWTFKSSSGKGTYETILYADGSTSCNCMGWTRHVASDGSRTCKHTRMVQQGIADDSAVSVWTDAQASAPVASPVAAKPVSQQTASQQFEAAPMRRVNWQKNKA